MDLLRTGSAWLEQTRTANATSPVTLARGSYQTPNVPATVGRSEFEVTDDESLMLKLQQRDYLILASDYKINGTAVLPQTGDKVIDSGVTYEVSGGHSEQSWRWSDLYRQTLRVHVKFVTDD